MDEIIKGGINFNDFIDNHKKKISIEFAEETIESFKKILDLKELLTYGKILIEKFDNSILITSYMNDYKESIAIDLDEDNFNNEKNEEKIKTAMKISNILVSQLELGGSKYSDYHFACGIISNSEKSYKELKLNEIISSETQEKLYKNGFEIIKF